MASTPEVSVVLPCLNEEEALPHVIEKIRNAFKAGGIEGEIVVCDNGSSDRSVELARSLGVRVVEEPERGYGRAYLTGFAAARGSILVMGDADDTYDFSLIPELISPIRSAKADFVTGSRYLGGGMGEIPFLHRLVGNPMLTAVLNLLFGCSYTDVYCGLRAFTRSSYDRIRPVTLGMEFNLELAINAALARLRIAEIPIRLAPRKGVSKLRTFSDGWRSLRMMLLYCPNKVFIWPGTVLVFAGAVFQAIPFLPGVTYEGRHFSIVTALFGMVSCILGFQIFSLGLHAKSYSWSRRFDSQNELLARLFRALSLERGLVLGFVTALAGVAILGGSVWRWLRSDLRPFERPEWISIAATLLVIGVEMIFTSLFVSAMSMEHAPSSPKPAGAQPKLLVLGTLFLLTGLLVPDARADIDNRQLFPLGESQALTANTGTGDASDAGAVYYNPAGLADVKEDRLTAGGSVYLNIDYNIGSLSAGVSLPYQESDFVSVPTTYVGTMKLGDWHLALEALVPDTQELNGDIDPTGSATDIGGTLSLKSSELWLGISAAHAINPQWSWGVSVFGISYSEMVSISLSGNVTANGTPTTVSAINRTSLSAFGFSAILGTKYKVSDDFSLGLRAQTPFIQASGSADSYSNQVVTPSGGSATPSVAYLANQRARFELPPDFTLGAALRVVPHWEILFDTSLQLAAHYVTLPDQYGSNSFNTKPTFRFNLGTVIELSSAVALNAGFYYNPSATDPDTESTGAAIIDFYGVTAGLVFRTERVRTAIGIVSVSGNGQETNTPGLPSVSLSEKALGGVLTTSYLF